MTNTLVNGVMSIVVQAILSILGVVATYFATVAVSYISKKRQALINQMGVDQYNSTYSIAKSIYYAIEQQFKFIQAAAEQKRKAFDAALLAKVPGLTQDELDHFREAICGEINAQTKQAQLLQPAPTIDTSTEAADPVQTNTDNMQRTSTTPVNTETLTPNAATTQQ